MIYDLPVPGGRLERVVRPGARPPICRSGARACHDAGARARDALRKFTIDRPDQSAVDKKGPGAADEHVQAVGSAGNALDRRSSRSRGAHELGDAAEADRDKQA